MRRYRTDLNCYFYTFGCKVNTCETAGMQSLLQSAGYTVVSQPEEADIFLFNSCTVTASGDSRLRHAMRKVRREHPDALLVLTGCYPQAYPDEAAAIPEADLVLGTKHRSRLPGLLAELCQNHARIAAVDSYAQQDDFEVLPCDTMPDNTRAFLKIQDGCNCFCSYCIIPYARGRCRSLPPEELRKAAANLPETAYLAEYNKDYELRYSGFTLGKSPSYGWSIHKMTHYTREGFIDALAYIAGDENNIRLSSPKPERTPEQEQGQTTVQGDFILVNYSEKAIALFGDTKPIKDALSDLGGRFNGRLTYRGEKCAGWIFPKAKEMQVRELIGMAG
mgnify:CR=1 FL=1